MLAATVLALHVACTHVAHLSGEGMREGEIERDMEEKLVLSLDGADFALLRDLLELRRWAEA